MNNTDMISEKLRGKGYRLTPQRLAILEILLEAGTHMSPQEVYEAARKDLPGLTEPTVYRTLTFLAEEGILMVTHTASGSLVYEIATSLHHHLVCRSCSESIEIEHEALDDLYQTLKKQTGYTIDERHITLFGLCPNCNGG